MRLCGRAVNYVQLVNAEGDVRVCGWNRNNIIGNLMEEDFSEILHGNRAENIRERMAKGDYSDCGIDNCPYLANGTMEDIMVDINEIPDYPMELYLAYEGVCNYNCTCCTSHKHMTDTREHDYSHSYDLLEERLKKVLPYVRTLGANGRGELFASKRILRLLASWQPLAPADQVSVVLETNGSLFDEKHWKQIENLGQYRLSVSITVMSFDETVYQHLSGVKLPISQIENNLRFVKSLRDQGIINYLELATVLQEENFREMPEFTRRCIEEFGADVVRIRPIMPGGIYDKNIAWFMDVRNPNHPYYSQYKAVMSHPIFRHPKVLLWSGTISSSLGEHPGIKSELVRKTVEYILDRPDFMQMLAKRIGKDGVNNVYIYGIGTLGKLLIRLNKGELVIKKIYDKYSKLKEWEGIPVVNPQCAAEDFMQEGVIIITTYGASEEVERELQSKGFGGSFIYLYDFVKEEGLC